MVRIQVPGEKTIWKPLRYSLFCRTLITFIYRYLVIILQEAIDEKKNKEERGLPSRTRSHNEGQTKKSTANSRVISYTRILDYKCFWSCYYYKG